MKSLPAQDFKTLFETSPGLYLVLLPDLTIVAASDAYLNATLTERESIVGHGLFEVFPDNPIDQDANGVSNLQASLNYVLQHGRPHAMAIQKYDIRNKDGTFVERYWSPLNSPVFNAQNELEYLIHKVEDVTNQKKSEDKFKSLLEAAPDAMIIANEKGEIVLINRQTEKLFGYTKEELIGKPLEILIPAGFRHKHIGHRTNYFKEPNVRSMGAGLEFFALHKTGTQIPVEISLSPLVTEEGIMVSASVRDITERKKAEENLRKTKKNFQLLVSSIRDYAIILLDENGSVAFWNTGAQHIKGYDAGEIIGKTLDVFYTAEDKEQGVPQHNLKMALQHGHYESEGLRVRKDGSTFYANIVYTSLVDEDGKLYGYAKVTRDITEKRKAEESIRFLASITENIQDPVISSDNNFIITRWSEAAEKLLEWKKDEVLGKTIDEIIKPDYPEETREQILALLESSGSWQGEVIYHTKSGKPVNMLATISKLKDAGGNATGILVLARDITSRKKAEEALSKINEELEQRVIERTEKLATSEMRFRSLIENSSEGITLTDEFANTIYRSPGSQKIMGNLPTENTINLTHPDDMQALKKIHAEVLSNPGMPVPFLGRFLHESGNYIWLEGTFTNLINVAVVNAIVANYRDITKRKELENLLHKSNALARIGSWEVDLIKGTVYWNDITKEIHEAENSFVPDLATGINFYKEGTSRDLITQKVKEAIELGKPWDEELQIITAKNNECWVRAIGEAEFVDDKCVRIYGSFQDIDKPKKVEEALLLSEARARKIFESDMIGFIYWNKKGEILDANNLFLTMTGYTREDLEKGLINWINMTPPEYAKLDSIALDQITCTGICEPFEKEYIRKNGSRFPIILGAAIFGENNNDLGVCYVMDITDHKKAQLEVQKLSEELEQKVIKRTEELQSANKEMEAFSYSVSHDLRAPLRSIIGFANILEEDYSSKLDEEAKRITGIIKSNTLKMGNLIDDLLTFSRMSRQKLVKTSVDTFEMIQHIIDSINANQNSSNIKWDISELPYMKADPSTIRQVWTNLISNAVKYSSHNDQPVIEIGFNKEGKQTVFYIRDNGVGFDDKYKDKLFKVFQRLHSTQEFEGTGVGLAIVEKIISKHGGKVWAEAEVNKGACFYFSLPDT